MMPDTLKERLSAIVDIHPSPEMMKSGIYHEYRAQAIEAMAAQIQRLPKYAQEFILNSGYRFGFGDDPSYIESAYGETLRSIGGAEGGHNDDARTITSTLRMEFDGWNAEKGMPEYKIDLRGIRNALSVALHEIGHGIDAQIARQLVTMGENYFSHTNFIGTEERMRDLDLGIEASLRHNNMTADQLSSGDMRTELNELMQLSRAAALEELYHGLPSEVRSTAQGRYLPLMHTMAEGYVTDKNNQHARRVEDIHPEFSRQTEAVEATAEMFRHYFTLKEAGLTDAQIGERFKKVSPNLWQWFSAEVLPRAERLNIDPLPLHELTNNQRSRYIEMVGYGAAERGEDIARVQSRAVNESASLTSAELSQRIDMLRAERMQREGPYLAAREEDVAALEKYFRNYGIEGDAGNFYDSLQRRTGDAAHFNFVGFASNPDAMLRQFAMTNERSGDIDLVVKLIQAKHGINILAPYNAQEALDAYILVGQENDAFMKQVMAKGTRGSEIKAALVEYVDAQIGGSGTQTSQQPLPQQQQQAQPPFNQADHDRQAQQLAEFNARQASVNQARNTSQIPQRQQQQQANAGYVNPEIPITLHQGVSDAFVGAVRGHISQLPPEVQTLLAEGGWQVRVIKNATHDRTKFDTLDAPEIRAAGATALGGPKEILFFEYQLNPTARGEGKIVSALSGPSDFEYTVRHEFGHALDRQLGIRSSTAVIAAHNADTSAMLPAVQDELNYFLGESGRAEVVADRLAERLKYWNTPETMHVTESWVKAHPSIDIAFDGAIKAHIVSRQNPHPQQQHEHSPIGQADIAAHPTDKPVYRVDTASASRPSLFPRQFTILMDTDHGDITMLRTFRDTLRNFVAAGGKHVIVEQDAVYQEIFGMIRSGQARLSDFDGVLHTSAYIPEHLQTEAQAIAREVMQIALEHGLEYTATDFTPRAISEFPDIHELILRLNSSPNKAEANAEFERLMSDPEFKERFDRFNTMFMEDRRASDAKLISEIAGKVKPDEKALVFYGQDHGYHLAQGLGIERSQGVLLTNSETEIGRDHAARLGKLPMLSDEPPLTQQSKTGEALQATAARSEHAKLSAGTTPYKVGHAHTDEPTHVEARAIAVKTELNPNTQPAQAHNEVVGKPLSGEAESFDTPLPKASGSASPHSGRVAANASRAGGGAGAAMGAMGIAGRLGETRAKAERVGGKQLETERDAMKGDIASVITGVSDLTPEAAQAASKVGAALRTMGRFAPIVAAGAAYLEVRAANAAQDGRRGAGAAGGFAGAMGVGMATGTTTGAIFGPWGAAIGGIAGALGAGYVGSEIGRTSQWGDQRQRDLDHKAQYALDQSVEVIAEIGRKRLRGEPWTDADKAAISTIGGLMVEHINRMQVLEIPANDIDGRLRQQYQIQQTQHVIDYLNGKTERLPMASQQRDAHLIPSIDALLPELNDPKLGWKHWLHPGAGAVDRTDVLRALSEYGVELHTLDKDGRKGVTIDELTTVLKALKVDQRGKVTPARGAAHVERPPEIDDETHANFRSSTGYERFKKAIEAKLPELEKLGITSAIGVEGRPLTLEDIDKTFKANGIRISEIDRNGDGTITTDEIVRALQSRGISGQDSVKTTRR